MVLTHFLRFLRIFLRFLILKMLMRKTLRGNEKHFFNSILSARLGLIFNLIFVILKFLLSLSGLFRLHFVYHVKKQNRTRKSGCKSLMAVPLTHFSGFREYL